MRTGTTLLGSLTIPGRPECLRQARQFVARTLGDDDPHAEVAALLTSELIANSMLHSDSRDGGTITVNLLAVPDGIRAEIIDAGGQTVPVLRPTRSGEPELPENGRGLQLVEALAARWDFSTDEAGTVTWFELAEPSPG
jgi:anti-sigma regulatory factor (Ser/Thr protein kinase)